MSVKSTAVMARRAEAPDSLDFFPTPPWATRALFECIGTSDRRNESVWEPAAGQGHMSEVLKEFFYNVFASDVHDYGADFGIGSFVGQGPDIAEYPDIESPEWIITNPPFNLAEDFLNRALATAEVGVALLLRTAWVESVGRYNRIFSVNPPSFIFQFSDRVPMVKGHWNPNASSATAYAWFVWCPCFPGIKQRTQFDWVKPGAPDRCARPNDIIRFAPKPKQEGLSV